MFVDRLVSDKAFTASSADKIYTVAEQHIHTYTSNYKFKISPFQKPTIFFYRIKLCTQFTQYLKYPSSYWKSWCHHFSRLRSVAGNRQTHVSLAELIIISVAVLPVYLQIKQIFNSQIIYDLIQILVVCGIRSTCGLWI